MAQHRAARRLPLRGSARPPRRLLTVLVLAVVLAVAGTTWFTGATFTSSSDTRATVTASADYYPPTVTLASPGVLVNGTVVLTATAGDTASGVTRVVFEVAAAGSSAWTTLCTDTTAPYSCSWDTTTRLDGDVQLRAVATDAAGFTAVSAPVTTRVANAATVVLGAVADVVRGAVPLSATVASANGRSVSTTFSYVDEAGKQTVISTCQNLVGTAPSCTWATGTLADTYDIKVVSTLGTGTSATVVQDARLDVIVDNAPPTVTVDAPSPMSGTVLVTAAALDADSGVAKVELGYRLPLGTWTTLCTVSAEPYRCRLDTTKLLNLTTYELRAVATDVAGNQAISPVISRRVENGVASVTISSPLAGELVRGTETLTADTATPLGTSVTSVQYERRAAGSTTWGAACTATVAPWSCAWNTTTVPSGPYELRAVMTYGTGLTQPSAVVAVTVDNNPLRAVDVQATNGGTLGRAGAGDTLVLTYSAPVDLTTIKAGWTGASTALTVTVQDKTLTGTATDRAIFNAGLGQVTFAQDYVRKGKSVAISATMTASASPTGGTIITIVLGSINTNQLRTSSVAGTMRWTPAAVRDTSGLAGSLATAAETGALDGDL